MKKLTKTALCALAVALLCAWTPSRAGAVGFGLGYSYFDSEIDTDDREPYGSLSNGVSFILDTNVARDKVFNYRLSLGYEQQKDTSRWDVDRMTMGHTFGFGMVKTGVARLYFGPRLDLGYGFNSEGRSEYWNFNIGVAPVLGVNFHLGPVVSLGLELGYEFSFYLVNYSDSRDDAGTRMGPFLNASILFRTSGDRYKDAD